MKEDIICATVAIAVSIAIMFLLSVIKKKCKCLARGFDSTFSVGIKLIFF